MEKWKNGKMEKWKNGKMEKWKNGKMEKGWKKGLPLAASVMKTLTGKVLAAFLVLSLGLSPLQGVLASDAAAPSRVAGQGSAMAHLMAQGDKAVKVMAGMEMSAKAMGDPCCSQHDCSSGHCSVCSSVPLSSLVTTSLSLPEFNPPAVSQGIYPHIASPLFRPPIA